MRILLSFIVLLSSLVLVACPKPTPPAPDAALLDAALAEASPEDASAPSPVALDAAPAPHDASSLDSGDAGSLSHQACWNLTRLGCQEGCDGGMCFADSGETCEATIDLALAHAMVDRRTIPCVASASSRAAVRACGAAWKDACQ